MDAKDIFAEQFGERVGRGSQATVYARDAVAVKVYQAGYPKEYVFYEAAVMGMVVKSGVPAAIPYEVLSVNGQMCLKMSRVMGKSVSDMMADKPDRYGEFMDDLVKLQITIHEKRILLPMRLKYKLKDLITFNEHLDAARKKAILELCERLPEGDALCHGDFYSSNVLLHEGVYRVIDWIDASKGNPLVDVCHSYVDYAVTSQEAADFYLERYCAASGANRDEILMWLPVQAGILYGQLPEHFNEKLLQLMDGR